MPVVPLNVENKHLKLYLRKNANGKTVKCMGYKVIAWKRQYHFSTVLKLLCISIHIPNFSLDFQNFNFSTITTIKRVELHHYGTFCRNSFNRNRNITIFRYFKMACAAILDFRNFELLTVGRVTYVKLLCRAKFRRYPSNRCRDMWVSMWCQFGLKMPIRARFYFFGHIFPKWCHLSS